MKILIAEDDPIACKVLTLTLKNFGHEVQVAHSGTEAWELFDQEPVRVIVSDWIMPGCDGLELCSKVRNRPKTAYTYFILLTAAHTTSDDYSLAMNSGVDDFLTKPFDGEVIRTRLHVAKRILHFTSEIRLLEELIPICSYCRKVSQDGIHWKQVEAYISERTGSSFTHGMCPDCYENQSRLIREL